MLAIRLQRVGRSGHAMYRMAIQESHRHPSSGRVGAYIGTFDPHTKEAKIQTELAQKYLDNGAQPSPKVVKLLEGAGVKMPKWVAKFEGKKAKAIRNPEKLRKNQPQEEPVKETADEAKTEPEAETPTEGTVETDETEEPATTE